MREKISKFSLLKSIFSHLFFLNKLVSKLSEIKEASIMAKKEKKKEKEDEKEFLLFRLSSSYLICDFWLGIPFLSVFVVRYYFSEPPCLRFSIDNRAQIRCLELKKASPAHRLRLDSFFTASDVNDPLLTIYPACTVL